MISLSVKSIKSIGIKPTIDLEVNHPDHNFLAEGIVTSNSHAVAYASLAAATVYLKFTYPKQFFLSLLKMTRHEPDPIGEISKIHKEMHLFGINLLKPNLIKSDLDFSIEGSDIRFGLLSVRGIAEKSIEKLKMFRGEYSTKFDLFQGAEACGLNFGILCALIQAGAFGEDFKQSRTLIVYEAQLWNVLTPNERKMAMALGPSFDFNLVQIVREMTQRLNEKGKPIIKPSRLETIKKRGQKYKEIFEINKHSEAFANWYYEKKLLGYTHGKTLIDIFSSEYLKLMPIQQVLNEPDNTPVHFVAHLEEDAHKKTSKAGNKYVSFDCLDETGSVNVKIFTKRLVAALEENNDKIPKADNIVVVKGTKKEGNCIFGDTYLIKTDKIFTRLAELKARKEELDSEPKDW